MICRITHLPLCRVSVGRIACNRSYRILGLDSPGGARIGVNIRVSRLPYSIEACGSDASPNGVWELNGPFDRSSMANRINARSRTRRRRRGSLAHVRSCGGAGL